MVQGGQASNSAPVEVLEEWQIPHRFIRAELSQEEIDCINVSRCYSLDFIPFVN